MAIRPEIGLSGSMCISMCMKFQAQNLFQDEKTADSPIFRQERTLWT